MPMIVETVVFWIVIPCALVDQHYHDDDCACPVCLKDSMQGDTNTSRNNLHCVWLLFISEVGIMFASSSSKHTHSLGVVDVLFFFDDFSDLLFHVRVRYHYICPWFCMGPTRGSTYKK